MARLADRLVTLDKWTGPTDQPTVRKPTATDARRATVRAMAREMHREFYAAIFAAQVKGKGNGR